MNHIAADLLESLSANAERADSQIDWPEASWEVLIQTGGAKWSIPRTLGGSEFSPIELLQGYELLGSACLTTAFILSQREAAVKRLLAGPALLQERYLPAMARGTAFLTVGLSQLTTSRLHHGPALRATPTSAGFRLDGDIPWVTGADRAEALVVGATLQNGEQLLMVLPTASVGVRIDPPMPLSALLGSRTCSVRCDAVEVPSENILAGPTETVLGKSGGGGLETSCLAVGLTRAATSFIEAESIRRQELREVFERLHQSTETLRNRLHQLANSPDPEAILALRVDCTRLVLKATQIALLIAKGNGFVHPHPVSRWSRQALFFLVWSCPRAVQDGVLAELLV